MTLRVHPDEIVRLADTPLLGVHSSWERVKLRGVADVLNGFAFRSAFFSKSDGVPLLRIRDVGKSTTDTRYSGPYEREYVVGQGDMVIGMDGDFRVARWSGEPALLNQRVCKVTVRDADLYEPDFLFYALPAYLDAINAHTSSVTVKHLSSRTVQEIPLPLPPINEQRRIVAAIEEQFSRLDAAEAGLRRARARTQQMQASVVGTRITDTTWPRIPIEDLAVLVTDGDHNPPKRVAAGVPHLTAKNVKRGRVVFDGCTFVTEEGFEATRKRYEPRAGDVLVTCVGTIGESAVLPQGLRFSADRNLAAIRLANNVDASYVRFALSCPTARRAMSEASGSTAQPHLYLRDLRALELPVPPLAEQKVIARQLERDLSLTDALATELEVALKRSAALRRAILDRAFTGGLVSQDPADAPASQLLQRLIAQRGAARKPSYHRGQLSA